MSLTFSATCPVLNVCFLLSMFISHFSLAAIVKQQNVIASSLLTVTHHDPSLHNNLIPHILTIYFPPTDLDCLGAPRGSVHDSPCSYGSESCASKLRSNRIVGKCSLSSCVVGRHNAFVPRWYTAL